MENKDDELFLKGIKNDVISKIDKLIKKDKSIKRYQKFQVYGSIIVAVFFMIYYFFLIVNYSFNSIWERCEIFFAIILLIRNTTIEKAVGPLKKDMKKLVENFRNRMTLKVCNCYGYCECKDKLNDYIKKKGIKIIDK